jgi:small subunit ribosomal protein S21
MVRLLVRDRETIQEAVRRFRKLVERSGLKKEMRRREFYEKPTAERKRKKAAAAKRHYKRIRSQMLPKKLY